MRPRSAPVGLIPAAGRATRVQPLPCSKEIYPVGFHQVRFGEETRPVPKVASHYLLERMRIAGVGEAFIVLGDGKWDIPAYLGDGEATGVRLAYLTIKDSPGTPYTVDRAFAFIEERAVAFGFADLIFEPPDAFAALLAHQVESDAAAVLGLFPAHDPSLVDMVEVDDHGRVVKIDIKPAETELRLAWIAAVWGPAFSRFLHDFVATAPPVCGGRELYVGDVFVAAIEAGLRVDGVAFPNGSYRDLGSAEELFGPVS